MIRIPVVHSEEDLVVDDRVGRWLIRHDFRILRTTSGHCRPFFRIRYSSTRWPVHVAVARWVVGGYRTGMFAKHLNGDVMDCRRRNLEAVRAKGEAGGGLPPLVDPLLPGLSSLG